MSELDSRHAPSNDNYTGKPTPDVQTWIFETRMRRQSDKLSRLIDLISAGMKAVLLRRFHEHPKRYIGLFNIMLGPQAVCTLTIRSDSSDSSFTIIQQEIGPGLGAFANSRLGARKERNFRSLDRYRRGSLLRFLYIMSSPSPPYSDLSFSVCLIANEYEQPCACFTCSPYSYIRKTSHLTVL